MNFKIHIISFIFFTSVAGCSRTEFNTLPNILICIADDVSYPHMGENCKWIKTPAFDRVANEGLFFENAYTPNAKCAPSRACLLTGRNPWQLEQAANMCAFFPSKYKTYPEALSERRYFVGYTGKPWAPGVPGEKGGKLRQLCGEMWNSIKLKPPTKGISSVDYASNFIEFYKNKPKNKPFCFWYGGHEPHRRYEYKSGIQSGKKISDIKEIPPFFPDNEVVRNDLLDYALEIEYFDAHLNKILNYLDSTGELNNTIVIVTADNGMPFPRAKTDEYNFSNHIPLSIMWKNGIKSPGRIVKDYVSFIDIAPTLFDIAGIDNEKDYGLQPFTGKSMLPIFQKINNTEKFRDFVLIGKEKHGVGRPNDLGYPIRGIVKGDMLYLHNYRNDLWPVGPPQTGYSNVDGSPTKTEVLKSRKSAEKKYLWKLSFAKRGIQELYNLKDDPYCINNLINNYDYSGIAMQLGKEMENELKKEADSRMFGQGDIFQNYESSENQYKNLYHRIVIEKEKLVPSWINASDIEPGFTE
ncbi:sulfatase-like hydrolase/transferase [Maribellus comscasis]|uniref:Sulfatase-like hydrolase/transferase n=1 Tax=Maribellus comscasis TaxID=2681766 RepID=A0A6I6JI29_9BACT|nr:sulfatase [Maribellus comscasis]QGY42555.1 sulfatase-like hydrolase/transferase [Maribellus comscasis]